MTYRTIRDAVRSTFEANWPHGATYPVLWHANERPLTPDPSVSPHWLLIAVEFGTEDVVAFGGGAGANERRQFGSVVVRVFSDAGRSEDTTLDLLAAAVAAFRSRRDGPLSFIGSITGLDDGGTDDGAWWMRAAVIGFEYRFSG